MGNNGCTQMLAHCNVPYAYTFEPEKFKRPNFFMKQIMKNFVKKIVTSPKPYKQNEQTAPAFVISNERDFEHEKSILIANINKAQQLGSTHFEGKENFYVRKNDCRRMEYHVLQTFRSSFTSV